MKMYKLGLENGLRILNGLAVNEHWITFDPKQRHKPLYGNKTDETELEINLN